MTPQSGPSAIAQGQDATMRNSLQSTYIRSIKVYRLRFLNEIWGTRLGNNANYYIPFDTDDLAVPNAALQPLVNDTSNYPTSASLMAFIRKEAIDKMGALDWPNCTKEDYVGKVKEFVVSLKQLYAKKLKEALTSPWESAMMEQEVGEFTSMDQLITDMTFGNSVSLSMSLLKAEGDSKLGFVPRENDVVEITMVYPDGKVHRVFTGLITAVTMQIQYGKMSEIQLSVSGLSKILGLSPMVVDRAIVSLYETSEDINRSEIVVPWSTTQFANKTVDEIFDYIVTNVLCGYTLDDGGNINNFGPLESKLNAEFSRIGSEQTGMLSKIEAEIKRCSDSYKRFGGDPEVVNKVVISSTGNYGVVTGVNKGGRRISLSDYASQLAAGMFNSIGLPPSTIDTLIEQMSNNTEIMGKINSSDLESGDTSMGTATDRGIRGQELAVALLVKAELEARKGIYIPDSITRLKGMHESKSFAVNMRYKFDTGVLTDDSLLQLIYIPLITLIALRNHQTDQDGNPGSVVARFQGKRSAVYEQTIRDSLQMYFSQLQTPAEVMDTMRKTSKYVMYENEDNQIVGEIPRYNDFSADEKSGETINDFIIFNYNGFQHTRQDNDMLSRLDTKLYWNIVKAPETSFFTGRYIDYAAMAKYGMRTDAPTMNINAITRAGMFMYSAIELINRNASTRALKLTVVANRKYRVGRLYFIADDLTELKVGVAPTGAQEFGSNTYANDGKLEDADGYVGYLTSINTTMTYGQPIEHTLGFNYVRRAKLMTDTTVSGGRIAANFKSISIQPLSFNPYTIGAKYEVFRSGIDGFCHDLSPLELAYHSISHIGL